MGLSRESGDEHVSGLVRLCREIEGEGGGESEEGKHRGGGERLRRVGSTEEVEEVEK